MKILFISGREPAYVRNAMLLKSLRKNGVEILDCTDSSATYIARYFKVLSKFIFRKNDDIDLIFVGFFGQPLVSIVKKLTNKPIIFDAFLSAYDTMCFDRKRFKPGSLAGRFMYWLDKHSCEQSGLVLLDTDAHIDYFIKTFGLPREKFRRVFVGADEALFYPREVGRKDRRLRVFYYCSFLPLHGTEYVVQAAARLQKDREIEFIVVGKGPEQTTVRKLAQRISADNIRFIDWVPYENLPLEIAKADICLGGHFSDIEKAQRVRAGKTYQFIAMKKPVIVGDCTGNRELFRHNDTAFLARMADAGALADAILELKANMSLREHIAEAGYKTFLEKCDTDSVGRELKRAIEAFR